MQRVNERIQKKSTDRRREENYLSYSGGFFCKLWTSSRRIWPRELSIFPSASLGGPRVSTRQKLPRRRHPYCPPRLANHEYRAPRCLSLYKLRGNSAEDSIPPRTFSSNSSFHRTLLYLRPIFVGTTSASPRLQIAFQRCSFSTAMRVTDMAQRISRCTRCSKGGKTGKISSAELSSLLGSKEILETRSFNPLVARLPPSLPCAIVREGI